MVRSENLLAMGQSCLRTGQAQQDLGQAPSDLRLWMHLYMVSIPPCISLPLTVEYVNFMDTVKSPPTMAFWASGQFWPISKGTQPWESI